MNLLKNLTIKSFFKYSVFLLAIVSTVFIWLTLLQFSEISADTKRQQVEMKTMLTLKDIRLHVIQVQQFLTDVGATHDEAGFEEAKQNFELGNTAFRELELLKPELIADIEKAEREFNEMNETGISMAWDYINKGREAGNASMKDPVNGLDIRSELLTHDLDQLVDTISVEFKQSNENMVLTQMSARNTSIGFTVGFILFVGLILLLAAQKILPALKQTFEALKRMNAGSGDLTRRLSITSKDEVGDISIEFNTFIQTLQTLFKGVVDSSTQISASSETLQTASSKAKSSMESQMRDVEQVASAMNEMTATVQEVARNSSSAAETVKEADNQAQEGKKVVTASIDVIDQLSIEIERGAAVINELESDSESVGTVLEVIRGIAEQTNLLALNAAIEAARAGEQGRGFAVVADEVRTLASRTQASTQEIQKIIERLQSGAGDAVSVMNDSKAKAKESVELAAQAGQALEKITQIMADATDKNSEIAHAVNEQGTVSEEINRNVVRISQESSETTLIISGIFEGSTQLDNVASELNGFVSQFKV